MNSMQIEDPGNRSTREIPLARVAKRENWNSHDYRSPLLITGPFCSKSDGHA